MSETDPILEKLKQALAEQDGLASQFLAAYPSQDTLEEIDLDPNFAQVIEFKQSTEKFLAKHIPTGIYGSWSTMTGPKGLKIAIENWLTEINQVLPKNLF